MSRFVALVQHANASHANPYACAGSDNAKSSLRLCRLPILTPVQVPKNAKNSLCLYRLLTIHTPILTLVKVANNADNSLHLCRLPTIHPPILMLVKAPHNDENFLCLCRIPTIHTPILTPVQAPNNSHTNTYACAGSRQFTCQSLHL
ncbi:hypothetical protein O181_101430 [Austropuccinia psidii MF-1]|uniref:Uncharacterized protein n=1 Tax=Austropuccinia psidii MF-1 TaxID=1389203 RepID=A0A9Q3JHJ4_9BASI|nr:hypothetical protein [Austropuccinia psidii MF-1]